MLRVQSFILFCLYGFSQVHGFFQFRNDKFLLQHGTSNITLDKTWIDQPIDHFNQNDHRTFKQKCFYYTKLWKSRGPIVVYIGGESPLHERGLLSDKAILLEILTSTGGAFYALEHRYYGDSQPFPKFSTENFYYLSSHQAMADLANFLLRLKATKQFKNSKVMVVGGSYSGNLATWMKVQYPKIVDVALASSAPVLAKTDFFEYYEAVTETFRTYGSEECVNKIANEFKRLQDLLKTPDGIEYLINEQNICRDVDMSRPENKFVFFSNKIGLYALAAQYGSPKLIQAICSRNNEFHPLYHLNESELYSSVHNCLNSRFDYMTNGFKNSKMLPWYYQCCTEFGYFQSTSSKNQMFGNVVNVKYFYEMCQFLFGETFNERRVDQGVMLTNYFYGGLTPFVRNVVFTNGDMDPWHRLGILQDLSKDNPAIYIKGSSHCRDILEEDINDSKSLKDARETVKKLMIRWLQ